MAATVGAFGAAAMICASTAPAARADDTTDILTAAESLFAVGQNYVESASADFSAGELVPGVAAYFDGINDELLGAPDNIIVGSVAVLAGEPLDSASDFPILDFPIPVPNSFADGVTLAQEFISAGQADFGDAATALASGDYAAAAYDGLVGSNVTSLVPIEEIILGSLVQIGK